MMHNLSLKYNYKSHSRPGQLLLKMPSCKVWHQTIMMVVSLWPLLLVVSCKLSHKQQCRIKRCNKCWVLCKTLKTWTLPHPSSVFRTINLHDFCQDCPYSATNTELTPPCPSRYWLYVRCSCRLWLHPLHPLNVPLQDGADSCENLIIFLVHILPSFSLAFEGWALLRSLDI